MQVIQGKTEITPAEVGYNAERLDVLNKRLQKIIDDGKIMCAMYCLSRKGKVFAHASLGKKTYHKENSELAQTDSIQYIASITKMFTAVAIMKLVEDGLTRLDVAVCEILPQFYRKPFDKINLFHLMTHTSGMFPDGGCFVDDAHLTAYDVLIAKYKISKGEKFDWIEASLDTGVRMEPGKQWAYCSFGFTILGAVIEKLTGISAEIYIMDNIVKPLGMTDTFFDADTSQKDRFLLQNKYIEDSLGGIKDEEDEMSDNLGLPRTSGGLNSTAYDLTIFGNMLLNKGTWNGVRIIGRKAVEKMTTLSIIGTPDYCWGANTPDRGYGVGFDMRFGPAYTYSPGTFNHEGYGASALYIDPKEEISAAWFVPAVEAGMFHADSLWNTMNIMWSGLL